MKMEAGRKTPYFSFTHFSCSWERTKILSQSLEKVGFQNRFEQRKHRACRCLLRQFHGKEMGGKGDKIICRSRDSGQLGVAEMAGTDYWGSLSIEAPPL